MQFSNFVAALLVSFLSLPTYAGDASRVGTNRICYEATKGSAPAHHDGMWVHNNKRMFYMDFARVNLPDSGNNAPRINVCRGRTGLFGDQPIHMKPWGTAWSCVRDDLVLEVNREEHESEKQITQVRVHFGESQIVEYDCEFDRHTYPSDF
jgi:hypothetical protein